MLDLDKKIMNIDSILCDNIDLLDYKISLDLWFLKTFYLNQEI